MFPKSDLNACLTALANSLVISSDYWSRWQQETYMLAKMLSDLKMIYYPDKQHTGQTVASAPPHTSTDDVFSDVRARLRDAQPAQLHM